MQVAPEVRETTLPVLARTFRERPADVVSLPRRVVGLERASLSGMQEQPQVLMCGFTKEHSDCYTVDFGHWEATLHSAAGGFEVRQLNLAEWAFGSLFLVSGFLTNRSAEGILLLLK